MKKSFFALLALVLFSMQTSASHYLGNDMRAKQIGPNSFVVELRIASDITSIALPSNSIGIFEQTTDSLISTVVLSLDSTRTMNLAIPGSAIGLLISYYSDTVQLGNNPNGYYASSSHCCRGTNMNYNSGSITYTCDFPNPNIPLGNSNPKFINYPDSLFLILGVSSVLDFSCSDPDGDSLVYSLIRPYSSTSGGGSKPYNLLLFNFGYSLTNLLGPGASVSINQSTGIVTGTTSQIGSFILAVKCEEYRNGVKIGEVIRDIMIPSINAPISTFLQQTEKNRIVNIFPNPNDGSFEIKLPENINTSYKLEIFDLTGKKIHSEIMNPIKNLIQLEQKTRGIHILVLTTESHQYTRRIIIE